ncbi:seryl-tRNA synthetase N-terminal domain protein, partial [Chlamydia psittaci C1/97]
CMP